MTIREAVERDQETEQGCLDLLRKTRWPQGASCPRCGDSRFNYHANQNGGKRKRLCLGCQRTYNELTGTPFANSKLPLHLWFRCALSMNQGKKYPTCDELAKRLGVKLTTAWRMRRVINRAQCDPVLGRLFLGGAS
jgi:transposase-like protein